MKNQGSTNKQLVAVDIAMLGRNSYFHENLTKIRAGVNYGM